jgi:glutaredoxin-related protein
MNKTALIFAAITILIVGAGVFFLGSGSTVNDNSLPSSTTPSQHQYFWSKTCPHCANVAEFMDTWEGKDVFEMEKFEINESTENTLLFLDRGTNICKIPRSTLGVPLLVTPEGKCFSGDTPIIDYLKSLEL